MYSAIKINNLNYKFKTWDIESEINWLKKINIFVWQNNSWKSRFMRSIFQNDIQFKSEFTDNTFNFITSSEDKIQEFINNLKIWSHFNYWIELRQLIWKEYFDENNSIYLKLSEIEKRIEILKNDHSTSIWNMTFAQINENIDKIYKSEMNELWFDKENINFSKTKKIYIPLMRWLKNPIKDGKDDLYENRVILDYFKEISNPNKGFEIFTWLSLYKEITDMLLWSHKDRIQVRHFEDYLKKNFFNGQDITLTPNNKDDVLYIKIWQNPDRAIYDLWDWIQNIIISTFPIFKYQNENLMLFIEEPEYWIHPWMQRILLKTFSKWIDFQKWNHQIFFTTHSNHLLDISLDKKINDQISIYQFEDTENDKEKVIKNITQNKEILNLLWVRNSSVFLSNCIIWVEWISDRIYIKKFLELYKDYDKKNFEEDKHYSILEYWWWNITHFNFDDENPDFDKISISAINKNNFLIADNDWSISWSSKYLKLSKLKDVFKDNIFFDMPEIENLITYEIYCQYLKKINNHENRKWQLKRNFWSKENFLKMIDIKDIWKIFKDIFIEFKDNEDIEWKQKFNKKNDILIICNSKKDFSEDITTIYLNSFDDLSDKAKELTKKLYNFIKSNN
ncbi:MAG: hypothetical protein ACD_49C00050G0035 [uncultured bacterium (gcode 4)]|uniref:ATPase AAA-type core domain-containing protein n=1 Tax=uncultured bacterium (gcode 4) TaxID=1234023 RepID=K2AE84_9BACT|nr:MAG: hypothetical protein ACD_49C00050G0035 [uncultured bacterium (gcode 4)]